MARAVLVVLSLVAPAVACAPSSERSASALATPDSASVADGGAVRLPAEVVDSLVAEDPLWAEALRIHYDALVLDGHVDTPTRMVDEGYAVGERHAPEPGRAHVDLPRMVEGGLDAVFFALYVHRDFGETPAGTARALRQLDEIERQVGALDGAEIARTAADVLRIARSGRKAILLGLEGGHALQARPEVLRDLAARGVRYVTLTHTNTNSWADASTDEPRNGGLSAHGREMIREMNRLGVVVDLSHTSDATVADALDVSEAPVLLSHSSMKALHDHPRNASDAVLRAVAARGGVVMVNFYDLFLTGGAATLDDVMAHLEHALAVAGPDHVGLGSDFDGVPSLPAGMEDVTRLPWITYRLLKAGHSEADVRKVLGGNALRVLAEAERTAG